jgi:phosphomannomutase
MAHQLFGTDGVRGKAGEYPLDHETVARVGGALDRAMTVTMSA